MTTPDTIRTQIAAIVRITVRRLKEKEKKIISLLNKIIC